MTYEEACRAYHEALGEGAMQPNHSMSRQGRNGTWTLYNIRGFLARVTAKGAVLDARLQPMEAEW